MARDFDKTNPDYINFGNPSYLDFTSDAMTASIWVRKHDNSGSKPFGRWDDVVGQQWLIQLGASDLLFALYVSGVKILNSKSNVLSNNVWQHIAVCYDGLTMRIYVDGVLEGSRAQSGNVTSRPNTNLTIGIGSNLDSPINAELAHAAIWNGRCLSPSEVLSLSNGINPLQIPEGLTFYAPLNGQSPEPDIVGGANGTLTGTTKSDEPPIPNSVVAP